MNASRTTLDHKEFIYYEGRYGGVKDRTLMTRMSRPMFAHLRTVALQESSDCSTVMRNALYEYLQNRGIKPFSPP